jgi:phosphoribosyl-AMP cyclohydrolase
MTSPQIDFAKMDGLVPGIVQDSTTGALLMVGFLNEQSYQHSLQTGYVTFWSRTRSKLWTKGETSGNRLRIVDAATDCDQDTLLFRVEVEGDGLVCHEGTVSCFTRPIALGSAAISDISEEGVILSESALKQERVILSGAKDLRLPLTDPEETTK